MKKNRIQKSLTPAVVAICGVAGSAYAGEVEDYSDKGFVADSPVAEYFKYGVKATAEYDDNIFRQEAGEESDLILRLAVPLELTNDAAAAHQWSLAYTPQYNFFLDNDGQNGLDHDAKLSYSRRLAKTSIDAGLRFRDTEGPSRFAGGSIERQRFGADVDVSHILTGKTRLDLALSAQDENFENFENPSLFDREIYNARLSALYQLSGKTQIGPYVGFQRVNVDSNPNHKAYSAGVTATYKAFAKTTFTGYVGAEYREFSGGGLSDDTTPTVQLGLTHRYSGKTSLSANFYHSVRPSYTNAGQSYEATGIQLGARHQASARLGLNAGVAYEHDNYFNVTSASALDFDTDYLKFNVGGDYVVNDNLTLNGSVIFATNDSGVDTRDFDNFRVIFGAAYQF